MLDLGGRGRALIEETYDRIRPLARQVLVLTEEPQLEAIRELLPQLGDDDLIVEPAARGTASALGLASMTLLERDPEAVLMSLPADHLIQGAAAYRAAVRKAARVASQTGDLVTVGLRPTHPATGYGYIRTGEATRRGALVVEEFVEKPDLASARRYQASGRYYWNLAMFSWRAAAFVEELAKRSPEHERGLRRVMAARRRGDEAAAGRAYRRLPNAAVDNAVMEHTDRLLLVPAAFGWLDVGSWSELAGALAQDVAGNHAEGEVLFLDTEGTFVAAQDVLVATIGLQDMIVVATPDAVLVAPKSRSQDVKRVVQELAATRRLKYL